MKRSRGFPRRGPRATHDEQMASYVETVIHSPFSVSSMFSGRPTDELPKLTYKFLLPEKGRARRKRARS